MKNRTKINSRRFAISDIHGCLKTFRKLLEDKIRLEKNDRLYLLGDYIDRGKDSKGVLDYIISLDEQGYIVHKLMGNHELMFLKTIGDSYHFKSWLYNGAEATFISLGLNISKISIEKAIRRIPEKYIDFIRQLKYNILLDDYWLVHAGFDFLAPDPFADTESMVWIRDFEVQQELVKKAVIVHGHTPIPIEIILRKAKEKSAQVINIDAGCVYKHRPRMGNLAALNLDNRQVTFITNIE